MNLPRPAAPPCVSRALISGSGFAATLPFSKVSAIPTPDLLVLQEYGFEWHNYLKPLHEQYPHAVLEPRHGSFGIALFSKRPLPDATVQEFPGTQIPFIHTRLTLDGRRVDLFGVHLQWPMTPRSFAARNRADRVSLNGSPVSRSHAGLR